MPSVVVERHEGVLEIILNRPEILNAVNSETIAALAAAVAEAAEDRAARVVLLRGAGPHFCAGGDISMFAELIGLAPAERQKALYRIVGTLHPLLIRMRHMPKPVLAVVQGAAAGFGLSLVLAADLALAAEDAVFTSGYIHLGTSPDGGMTATLPHIVGIKHAAELMLLGDRFDAQRALALGLVNRVVSADALDEEAAALAARLAAGPAHAYGRTKGLLQATLGDAFDAQLRRETESFAACAATEDFAEGVRAFLEKRRPCSPAKDEGAMTTYRRLWRAILVAVIGAGALSGCYYDAYTGLWYSYPPYYYPYPYPMAYPYGPGYPNPYPAGQGPNPAPGYPSGPPGSAPVEQTPLPPSS
jgi:2-(1,2-epoxy-1,2-dihydrophenyl)acetyl-CoA isomerase